MANWEDYDREFPSLSNNPQAPSSGQSSMWSTAGSRNAGAVGPRSQGTPISASQQNDQSDFFSAPSRIPSTQNTFRFGGQPGLNQSSQAQTGTTDDFPPLNRNGNGDIGQDRGATLISTIGFGAQSSIGGSNAQGSRAGNGLLNALSANSRSSEVRSPTSGRLLEIHDLTSGSLLIIWNGQDLELRMAGILWPRKRLTRSLSRSEKAASLHKRPYQALSVWRQSFETH
jgi:hypothetical protein